MKTFAGTGTASYGYVGYAATYVYLYFPRDIAFDSSSNIYIADQNNHQIRKVTQSTTIISTFAGSGSAGCNGDGIAAVSAYLYYPTGLVQ